MIQSQLMTTSASVSEIFDIAVAVIASFGGAGLLIFVLSSWLGKVWATRIMEHERAELSISIENTKADLMRSIEHEKAQLAKLHETHKNKLQELSIQREDALNRKRDVYTELATKMRILLRANIKPEQLEKEKWAFLAAYDKGYIWASEAVIEAIGDLFETLKSKSVVDTQLRTPVTTTSNAVKGAAAVSKTLDAKGRKLYQHCMLEMRRDSGFESSTSEYHVISFT